MFPLPETANPIAAFEFVQENEAPKGELVNGDTTAMLPGQKVNGFKPVTTETGFTFATTCMGTPGQAPATTGVMV